MDLSIKKSNEKCIVGMSSQRLDVSNMQSFKKALNEVVDNGNTNIVLDLSGVSFVDSSGLSVFIGLFKRLNGIEGATLELSGLEEQPTELFQITQLDKVFSITQAV